ncbi:putative glycolipid-binding domain-containing protein [Pseudonocardia acidicola]|uniref:Glycolipid-binding domain-containing protein n=1 Tax=Pseudonocardia acidicola TaxID=2724939 RepID=A0ABX1SDK5_9PSEU|nr:putative glycolipid-binding domain-containing protein [Pseudonocardia acidicola]NMH98344.1 putative glycolipid-binding domain-containing protein [Pseudonocardia acidicola]
MTSMLTWQADGEVGLEGARFLPGAGGFRALSRMVRSGAGGEFTASYRLVVGEDGTVQRLSVTAATAERERHLTINRTEDGQWLLDTGSGSAQPEFGSAVDVDLEYSPLFNTLPIRRLGLHREPGDHTLSVVFVSLPDLEVRLVDQRYRTVSTLTGGDGSGQAVVEFSSGDVTAELVVDPDGVICHYPGLARRVSPQGATPAAG